MCATDRKGAVSSRLRLIYVMTTALCIQMVFWILIFPASWRVGQSESHDRMLEEVTKPGSIQPRQLIFKYAGQTVVHVTHILPGSVWAGIIPFQLHDGFRQRNKKLHRLMGMVFLACSFLIAIGVFVIMNKGLLFENFFEDIEPSKFKQTEISLSILTGWFIYTGAKAFLHAKARRFHLHRKFMLRHIAAGLWVSLQRFLINNVAQFIFRPPVAPETQKAIFGQSGMLATVCTIAVAEYVIKEMDSKKKDS